MVDLFSSLEDLPEDVIDGAVELVRRLKPSTNNEEELCDACSVLSAYYEVCNLKVPEAIPWKREPPRSNVLSPFGPTLGPMDTVEIAKSVWERQFAAYEKDVSARRYSRNKAGALERLNSIKPPEFGYAVLNNNEKKECRGYLEKIKEIIDASIILEKKKNSIFSQINKLLREIDRAGTRTDIVFAFVSELGFHAGEFGKNAEPLFAEARKLIKAVSENRTRREGTELPKPDDMFHLPAPKDEE
jgi:hypothetical protein